MGFNEAAFNYYISSDHIKGDDLDLIRKNFKNKEFECLLDIAAGAGHCAAAVPAKRRYTLDPSMPMLKTAKEKFGLNLPVCAVAESIPFSDNTFDILTCRIAMHHFKNPDLFFREVKRVLRPLGWMVLIDNIVDVEDSYLNVIEYIRDNTHIRSYRLDEILRFARDDFRLIDYACIFKKHDFPEWAGRLAEGPEAVERIEQAFKDLPDSIQKELEVEKTYGRISAYTDKKGFFIFRSV
ncbi:methyltransferase domain-containing protein [Geovibrio thiophilus]|uniref:Methyltransferase domain-containing protein n=1 Tax=Geovibrio thiophilus TaxID=139438 RepID=A0A410JV18_9BACT|nr:methyltransferase domain-containing protein [Geovibrio thiophilus]QAR31895.1 methyltransferase domain-containing protein [Geovibrio thiophilus]